jgi:hypothetical protein
MTGFLDLWRRARAETLSLALVAAFLILDFGFDVRWPFEVFYLGAAILSVAMLGIWAAAVATEHKEKKRNAR